MSSLFRNLLIALGVTLVLGLLYATLFKGDETEDTELLYEEEETEATLQTGRILSDIQQIESYDIAGNSSIFEDARFLHLVDSREDLVEEGTGRDNPFTPVQ